MSFRWFVYWCALCGGWAAAVGWAMGRPLGAEDALASAGIKGLCLGAAVALALGLLDALWVYSARQVRQVAPRAFVCLLVASVGGLLGGMFGQVLFQWKNLPVLLVAGWTFTGLIVGLSLAAYDLSTSWVFVEGGRDAGRKALRTSLGGALGGMLGGVLSWLLRGAWDQLLPGKADLWSPSLSGFVALGLCIGLMIALAQVVLKEAWLKVEGGFRAGREMLLSKPILTIGRAESCDLGLFGDPAIDKLHARIARQGNDYLIADAGSSAGTFVNGARISEPTLLRSGDEVRIGSATLRFHLGGKSSVAVTSPAAVAVSRKGPWQG
jgi:hypothetical protein